MIADYTYVAFAAPDQPVRACPEWRRCIVCQGTGQLINAAMLPIPGTECPCCDIGIVEAATGQTI